MYGQVCFFPSIYLVCLGVPIQQCCKDLARYTARTSTTVLASSAQSVRLISTAGSALHRGRRRSSQCRFKPYRTPAATSASSRVRFAVAFTVKSCVSTTLRSGRRIPPDSCRSTTSIAIITRRRGGGMSAGIVGRTRWWREGEVPLPRVRNDVW